MTFAELGDLCSRLFDIRVDGSMTIAQLHYMLDGYISRNHHHDGGAGHDRACRARKEEGLAKWNECRAEREQLSHVQQHLHYRAAIGKPLRPFVVCRAGA
ncbi:MAG TPA: hypothetical protein V6D05_03130 [Stenomitos sp.]